MEEKGDWLNIFCPEDGCFWKGGTELPYSDNASCN
jgi:hypothetical protein